MRVITILTILFSTHVSMAQGNLKVEQNTQPVSIKVAYLGSLIYPGMKVGAEYPIVTKRLVHQNDSSSVIKIKQQKIALHLGWYHHKAFHDHFMLTAGYVWRKTRRSGWFTDIEPQLGISRTFIAGTVYTVDQNKVNKKNAAGDWFFASQLSLSVGKAINIKSSDKALQIYLRPSLLFFYPYNNFIYGRPSLEIGAIYSVRSFLAVRSKQILIKR